MREEIKKIIDENERRTLLKRTKFNPVTGEGAVGVRTRVVIEDYPIRVQHLPNTMLRNKYVKRIIACKSIRSYIGNVLKVEYNVQTYNAVISQFDRVRIRHDFCYWAAMYATIKSKGKGDIHFRLNRPQRLLLDKLENMRTNNLPIRIILLKARQWGGSTLIQIYYAWLQLVHRKGLNSLIVAQVNRTAADIKDMFNRLLSYYPTSLLHEISDNYNENEKIIENVDAAGSIKRIPSRNCKISIGSAEKPDSVRGSDYSLVHCSEVGLWRKTEGRSPEDIVRSACSGILYKPYTAIIYESTANGVGNFFHSEYIAATDKQSNSQFEPLFIPWYLIDNYTLTCNVEEIAELIYEHREQKEADNNRCASGQYIWSLWNRGATLDAIAWYIAERAKFTSDAAMASEYPSDDIEAFANSGNIVFDRYMCEDMRSTCKDARYVGELQAEGNEDAAALANIHFVPDQSGNLQVWSMPEIDDNERVAHRYIVSVDIGGRSASADYSVICVIDRLNMMSGGNPSIVAQWYGHTDYDILAWKAAQIASWYDDALLVIESNTLETKDNADGVGNSLYILNRIRSVYSNLYVREQSEDDIRAHMPAKLGFHTNTKTKPIIINDLKRIIRDRLYIERDTRCIDEYITYEQKPNGAYGAIDGKHDDLLMTRAIGLYICFKSMPIPTIVDAEQKYIYHTEQISEATIG